MFVHKCNCNLCRGPDPEEMKISCGLLIFCNHKPRVREKVEVEVVVVTVVEVVMVVVNHLW